MSDALFTELSIEQQELIAGGDGLSYQIPTIYDKVYTNYLAQNNAQSLNFLVASGPSGSTVGQQFVNQSMTIDTSANKLFKFWN